MLSKAKYVPSLAAMGVVCASILFGAAQSTPSTNPADLLRQSTVSDLLTGPRPMGELGKSLGEKITIEGNYNPAMVENPILVERVDDKPFHDSLLIKVKGLDLKEGVHYKLEGYESGGFEGDPVWLSPGIQQPFQYRPCFVVTKVIEPAQR